MVDKAFDRAALIRYIIEFSFVTKQIVYNSFSVTFRKSIFQKFIKTELNDRVKN